MVVVSVRGSKEGVVGICTTLLTFDGGASISVVVEIMVL